MKKILTLLTILVILITCSACFANSNSSKVISDNITDAVEDDIINVEETTEEMSSSNENNVDSSIIDKNESDNEFIIDETSNFEVHFIDVGQGDSELVICDEHYMLIDGGPSSASSLIYTYLKNLGITYLDYVICTHPDEDHVGGLSGALNYASLGVAYCPCSKDTRAYQSFVKYVNEHDVEIEIPKIGTSFNLGSAKVEILASNVGSDNDASIVTKISYGDNVFLLMGDAGTDVEDYLINKKIDIKCDVLKVAHHGSRYSTGYQFLYLAEPKYAIISVGSNNSYGHPTEEALSKLRDADVKTFRTDIQGDIICKSDGKNITFKVEKNSDVDTYKEIDKNSLQKKEEIENSNQSSKDNTEFIYCLNTSSKKFHYSWCSSVSAMSEKNKKYSNDDRNSIISQGYTPCKKCNP